MSVTALPSPGLQLPVTRVPYWLGHDDRRALAEAIADLLCQVRVLPALADLLGAVLTELGVAEARDHVWPTKTQIVRQATGYTSDVLPIRMSREERDAVLTIPSLPTSVRTALAGGKES